MTALLLLLASCNPFPCEDNEILLEDGSCLPPTGSDTADTSVDDSGIDDTGAPIDWLEISSDCSVPSDLHGDPLVQRSEVFLGQDTPGESFAEFVDLDLRGDVLLGVGQGGLMPFNVSDLGHPGFQGFFPKEHGRYYKVEWLDDRYVVASHRDMGLELIDLEDPSAPQLMGTVNGAGYEGLLAYGDHLYVTKRGQGVVVFERDGNSLKQVGSVDGLDAPWEISAAMSSVAYVADAGLGLVPVDLSDPTAPTLGTPVDMEGTVLHVAAAEGHVFLSMGASGVAIFETSDPMAPTEVARVQTGGSAVMAWVDQSLLWVVDHEGVVVFDVSDPANPQVQAREITEQFALSVRSSGPTAFVGDWNYMRIFELDTSIQAPHLEPSSSRVLLDPEGGVQTLTLRNLGAGTLDLAGISVDGADVGVSVQSLSVAPGESTLLRLDYAGGADMRGTLCIASNDSDQPLQVLDLEAGLLDSFIGQPAPDFVLTDLDGQSHSMKEQLGHPVVLAYFATW